MTHCELMQACRKVRDELGRKGTVTVSASLSEQYSEYFQRYGEGYETCWTISFHDSLGNDHVQASLIPSMVAAFETWKADMTARFSGVVSDAQEVADVLDVHLAASDAN